MANYLLEALKRQKLQQMSHQPQPLPPDLLGMMSNAESKLYDRSMIYKALKDAVTAPGRAYRGEIDALMDPRGAMEEAMNTAGMAQLGGIPGGARGPGSVGMITYHGSPHKFDKFDMSKIGTGEGAQAYGHGLYLAQAQKVADEYAGKLSQKVIEIPGFTPNTPVEHDLIASLSKRANTTQYGSGASAALDDLRSVARTGQGERKDAAQKMLSAMGDFGSPVLTDTGHLYKVDIPDEAVARMLDWDKPLSQQAPEVQAAIRQQMPDNAWDVMKDRRGQDYLEHYWNGGIGGSGQSNFASSRIKELGIPGIRYLDGGSRTAGDGTSNFVLFDDQLPRILERNGEATGLKPWQPGEANALLGISQHVGTPVGTRPRNALGQEEANLYDYMSRE